MTRQGFKLLRKLMVWSTVLVQVHLFFVGELHRHLGADPLSENQQQTCHSVGLARATSDTNPLCVACQIARQGSVQPAPQSLGILHLFKERSDPSNPAFCFPSVFQVPSSGRDPPRS
jgi:hypothetical protein